jgi:dTMP kinase
MLTMARNKGILIAVEGIDGTGKTTQVGLLGNALNDADQLVVISKEPTDGRWGKLIRESAAKGRLPLDQELNAFVEDRKEHIANVIAPGLREGKIVILDRYFYSTIAYQGSRGADKRDLLDKMLAFAPVPDMVFLLDADPAVTIERIANGRNETPNEFERHESLTKCRSIFLELSKSRDEIFVIDGHLNIANVQTTIIDRLLKNALRHKRCAESDECNVVNSMYRKTGKCQWAQLSKRLHRAVP